MAEYKTYQNFVETPNGVLTTFTTSEVFVVNSLTIMQGSLLYTDDDFSYTDSQTIEFDTAPPAPSGAGNLYILSGWFGSVVLPELDTGTYYCTSADLYNRKSEDMITMFTDDDDDSSPDEAVMNAAIRWAYNEINAALADRYVNYIPFTSSTIPGFVYDTAITFAVYLLCYRTKDTIQEGSALSKEYDEARARLQKIAEGKTALMLADGTIATDSKRGSSKEATMSPDAYDDDYKPIFSRDSLYNYTERRY